jgi:hypothetical protein
MPALSSHQSSKTTKLLFLGESGSGKTGALASLAAAGYNLRILDLDNGLDVLANILSTPSNHYPPDSISRVHYITVTDKMTAKNGKVYPTSAKVWEKSMGLLCEWKDGDINYGHINTWTEKDVLVIDSFTMLSEAALRYVLALNARSTERPQLQDWGAAQSLIKSLIEMLYDDSIKCNIIVNCHIKYIGEDNGPQRGLPYTLGQALPPIIGRYFNSTLMAKSVGQGTNVKRKILTNTTGTVELKNTAPTKVAPEYPLETGLADYFKAVRNNLQEKTK